MAPTIISCEQGTEEWHRARMGMPTASMFKSILAKGADKMRSSYMAILAGERITGEPHKGFVNGDMERGHDLEPKARAEYALDNNIDFERVGFIINGRQGCSPDALIGVNGMLEIKTAQPNVLAALIHAYRKSVEFPPVHKAQCQGGLWVAEREWIDLAIYWPKMPLFIVRANRDETYIKHLAAEVDRFNDDLNEMVEGIRKFGHGA